MGLPAQERFTLQEVAASLERSVPYVEELVCTLQFRYIIVECVVRGRASRTHLYFDRDLFQRQNPHPPQAAWRTVLTTKEIKEQEARLIAKLRSLHAKRPKSVAYTELARKEIARIQNDEDVMPTHREIGPNEFADLWTPFPPSSRWERPTGNVVIYIPGIALEAFKKEHGLPEEASTKPARELDRSPAPDVSKIDDEKWYSTHLAARFLGVSRKHLQNHIADEKYGAILRNGRRLIQGKTLRRLLEQKDSAS